MAKTAVDMKLGQFGKHNGCIVIRVKEGLARLEAPFDTLTWWADSFAPIVEILPEAKLLFFENPLFLGR